MINKETLHNIPVASAIRKSTFSVHQLTNHRHLPQYFSNERKGMLRSSQGVEIDSGNPANRKDLNQHGIVALIFGNKSVSFNGKH